MTDHLIYRPGIRKWIRDAPDDDLHALAAVCVTTADEAAVRIGEEARTELSYRWCHCGRRTAIDADRCLIHGRSIHEGVREGLQARYGGTDITLTEGFVPAEVFCADGHGNMAGNNFCQACAVPMRDPSQTAPDASVSKRGPRRARDGGVLDELTHNALVARCVRLGLDAEGSRSELIERLWAAR